MLTRADVDRLAYRKPQLETELQGTTPERKAEIEAELAQINADLKAFAKDTQATAQQGQRQAGTSADDQGA